MSGYSILILICSTALSHSDGQPKTALDVVRGPKASQLNSGRGNPPVSLVALSRRLIVGGMR